MMPADRAVLVGAMYNADVLFNGEILRVVAMSRVPTDAESNALVADCNVVFGLSL
jgi:hypothetical protein